MSVEEIAGVVVEKVALLLVGGLMMLSDCEELVGSDIYKN